MYKAKFRFWCQMSQKFLFQGMGLDLQDVNDKLTDIPRAEVIAQQYIGMQDMNGKEIYEGDVLFCYPDNKARVLLNDADVQIYEVRDDLPKSPFKDVIIHKGIVEYSVPEFRLRLLNSKGISSISINGYVFEVAGNIFENPELTHE